MFMDVATRGTLTLRLVAPTCGSRSLPGVLQRLQDRLRLADLVCAEHRHDPYLWVAHELVEVAHHLGTAHEAVDGLVAAVVHLRGALVHKVVLACRIVDLVAENGLVVVLIGWPQQHELLRLGEVVVGEHDAALGQVEGLLHRVALQQGSVERFGELLLGLALGLLGQRTG